MTSETHFFTLEFSDTVLERVTAAGVIYNLTPGERRRQQPMIARAIAELGVALELTPGQIAEQQDIADQINNPRRPIRNTLPTDTI